MKLETALIPVSVPLLVISCFRIHFDTSLLVYERVCAGFITAQSRFMDQEGQEQMKYLGKERNHLHRRML
jgi:hypothetical protein